VLISALETAASDIAARLSTDASRLAQVVGCEPAGHDDVACLTSFVERFGRRALRRPLSAPEVQAFVALGTTFAEQQQDFDEAVDVIVRALLQHPNFVYRIEHGSATEEPGIYRLDDFEVATRLSYLVWGSTPDDALLEDAEAGHLSTSEDVRAAALRLLADDRARTRVDRFHAMWLGYYRLPHAADLTAAMRNETRALVEQVVFVDRSPWLDLFTAPGTFIDDLLAEHYELPAPGSNAPVWVEYGSSGRQGLLSHGSFLSVAGKFGDTSPTQRGKLIRKRLLCQEIPPPPPDVNVDEPPASADSECKWDRYEVHRQSGSCKSCHDLIDPVGFGLENFDEQGRYREHDDGYPECTIAGDGDIDGVPFNGPEGLADVLVESETLDRCVVRQVYRFAMGHEASDDDARYVDDLVASFRADGHRFDELILALVSDEAFLFRREEQP
jgi:hypothetical protein